MKEQIDLVAEAFEIKAFKTGMLYSQEIIEAVAQSIQTHLKEVFYVLDPVMVASSGAPLLKTEAIEILKAKLIPCASLVTPNCDEASLLWGKKIENEEDLKTAGNDLVKRYGVPFLMKGGHLKNQKAIDFLITSDGDEELFEAERVPHVDPHGTGCTYSAAITCGLAEGKTLSESVAQAKRYMTTAIQNHFDSRGYQVLNHFTPVQN